MIPYTVGIHFPHTQHLDLFYRKNWRTSRNIRKIAKVQPIAHIGVAIDARWENKILFAILPVGFCVFIQSTQSLSLSLHTKRGSRWSIIPRKEREPSPFRRSFLSLSAVILRSFLFSPLSALTHTHTHTERESSQLPFYRIKLL